MAAVLLIARAMKADTRSISMATAKPFLGVMTVVCALYAGKTFARNEAWRDNLSLYLTGMETAPDSWRAQYLLGVEYTKMISTEADLATKKELYSKAITCFNRSLQILPNNSDVYLLKGYAEEFAGNNDSALVSYTNTITLDSSNTQAQVNLGGILLRGGKLDDAIILLSKVLARDPNNLGALTNTGAAYGNKGMFKESITYYEKAIQLQPQQQANVYMSMCNVYRYLGDSANTQKYRTLLNQASSGQ
jgi:tetratricopeptide (TPR) repeat protein